MDVWKQLPDEKLTKRFYFLQKGKGPSMQLVSPEQGVIERAKSTLKRQLNTFSPTKSTHSCARKRRRKTPTKKKAPTKKKKGKRIGKGRKRR